MCPAVPRPVTSSLRRAGFDSLYSNSGKLVRFATQSGSTKTLTRLSELSSSVGWLKFWRGCQSCHPPKSWSSKILPRLHSEQSSSGKSKPRIELTFLQVPNPLSTYRSSSLSLFVTSPTSNCCSSSSPIIDLFCGNQLNVCRPCRLPALKWWDRAWAVSYRR